MSLDESSVLMDRALVTMCVDLPESLGLYNTAKDQFSLAAIRAVPLLEMVGPESRKLALVRDWMRAYEPGEDQPPTTEIRLEALKETAKRERKERERQQQKEKHALLTSEGDGGEKKSKKKKKKKSKEKAPAAEKTKAKSKEKAKKNKSNGSKKHHVLVDSDEDVLSIEDSSSSSEESSSESSSGSDSDDNRGKKRKNSAGNLPPKEIVLSSDEDDEPNDMFDTDDPDVYEVEKILNKRPGDGYGQQDLYEVKWEGYDETTWEPAANISKDLIDEYEGQPVREDVYTVEDIIDRRSKRDPTTRLKTYQYKVKWVGYDDLTWEPAENLPHNLRRKFDQKYENRKRRRT
ncbi:hypothetical protein PHYBOEH_008681 [Phytophthora boehmeriae]|uniref:Chromo domain-containing protein n=1 Tax=Phytophthora boehmeriae TaxID=109152 RepID=A0A8T1W2Y4_9STRA|nr:hypothetical protein PHYBOEH_008681 [Phytophthora boehmeriae]